MDCKHETSFWSVIGLFNTIYRLAEWENSYLIHRTTLIYESYEDHVIDMIPSSPVPHLCVSKWF